MLEHFANPAPGQIDTPWIFGPPIRAVCKSFLWLVPEGSRADFPLNSWGWLVAALGTFQAEVEAGVLRSIDSRTDDLGWVNPVIALMHLSARAAAEGRLDAGWRYLNAATVLREARCPAGARNGAMSG